MNSIKFENKLISPSKIVCVGRNYVEHIKEMNSEMPSAPVLFMKPNSAISDDLYSGLKGENHFEAEICFLIKDGQLSAIGFGLDLTKRALQRELKDKQLPWERSKAFDGSAVFSQFSSFNNIEDISMQLFIDDKLVQHADYELMIHKPLSLLDNIQSQFSLIDGDIIMTGTPKGVGAIIKGVKFEAKIFEGKTLLINESWTAK